MLDHFCHCVEEAMRWPPAKHLPDFSHLPNQGRRHLIGLKFDVVVPVETDALKCSLKEVSNRMKLSGSDEDRKSVV